MLLTVVLAAGTAFGTMPSIVTPPDWRRTPTAEEMAAAYPEAAWHADIEGWATLACTVAASGRLEQCAVLEEQPSGQGFGAAALQLSTLFEMKPRTVDGRPVGGAKVRIPLAFKIPEPEEPTAEDLQFGIECYGVLGSAYDADPSRADLPPLLAELRRAFLLVGDHLGMRREDVTRLMERARSQPSKDEAVIQACLTPLR